jgi:hypothetical protein
MSARLGLLALLLSAPLHAQEQTTYVQNGFQHAATKAFYSAGVYAVLREGLGMKKTPAALLSTVGLWAVTKGLMAAKHPNWLGPWTLGDAVHDLAWHTLLVVPLALGPRGHPWRAGLSLLGLGVGIVVTRGWALPRW